MPAVAKARRGRIRDEQQARQKREAILDAAATVFARQGFRNTEIQSVADAINVAKGTLYLYFKSKEELFLAAVDRGMRRLVDAVDAATEAVADPLDKISVGIRTYLKFFKDCPEYVELLLQERAEFRGRKKPTYFAHREANLDRWRSLYEELIAAGRVRAMPVDRILTVISELMYGSMFISQFTAPGKSVETQTADIVDILFNGLLTPSERRRRESCR